MVSMPQLDILTFASTTLTIFIGYIGGYLLFSLYIFLDLLNKVKNSNLFLYQTYINIVNLMKKNNSLITFFSIQPFKKTLKCFTLNF